ncbi:TPA: hypothetical protein QHP34_004002 [Citrobacter braakii]|uniref:hypothetical protein n=1 Tax=Citrobacter braakii TaxID=57706 RepID=UPI0027EA17E3|nr:hypothetical protein [Citrobacter braakii]
MIEDMSKPTPLKDGYQPEERGYQPKNEQSRTGGYKPLKKTVQPAPPPKKP